jgi:hypothetical protein
MNATEVLIRAGCNADYSERAADRILQRQRKAGLIKYVHGFWRKKRVMSRDDWPQSTPAQSEFVE